MPNHHYHIHLACVADDLWLQTAQDDVCIYFEERAFLTRDLFINRPQSANYSWRCVNSCDAVLLLIGSSYGKTNISGVSQLHLSYSNAKTKNKPVFVFIHSSLLNPLNDNQRLREFVKMIENQASESMWYFDDKTDLFSLLDETVGRLLNFNQSANKLMPKSTSINGILNQKFGIAKLPKTMLDLDSGFLVSCMAHAFEGGTLIEVLFSVEMTWRQILDALKALNAPFSDQRLSKLLAELIDKNQANQMVKTRHPNVHAISRYQVLKADVLWIKDELQLAGQIVPAEQDAFWQLATVL